MRLICTIALLCIATTLFSQKKNSLLWEISGNGLEQSSYLYGTMHVSKKIAFRLDDIFFEALDESEIIALESDPDTWLDNEIHRGPDGYGFGYGLDPKGFYKEACELESPSAKDIGEYLAFDDRLINNILYRTNEYAQNFEEETYLDMFIYQAGAKYNKPIVALENLEESSTLVARANLNAMKNKPDEWLQKKMQGQDLQYLMQNAYRERNIDLLDSIDKAMYTDYYRKNMLYIRNENMANSLDSVIRSAKVFAGIGAAHLPGDNGVIELMRAKGYTVKPLVSQATEKGKSLKNKLVQKVRATSLSAQGPEDKSFSMLLPGKLYPVSEGQNTIYVSPDLANGSYLMVNRIPTYSILKEEGNHHIQDIEALLFENIPGEIVRKSQITKDGIPGLDIVNRLKNGDFKRYHIYIKTLEILIFKMAGEGDYVSRYSDRIFDSLKFKDKTDTTERLSSAYKDFTIEMPSDYIFYNPSRDGLRMIEGYDPGNDSYYFLRRVSLNDLSSVEEDDFELRQIQKRFYQQLNLEAEGEIQIGNTLRSQAVFDHEEGKVLYLQSCLKGGDYFLLAALTSNKEQSEAFLNSFKLQDGIYTEAFEQIRDTAMLFTTVSPVKPKRFVENSHGYFRRQTKPKPYNPFTKKTRYQNRNNETITVELNKSHDYLSFPHIDSLWILRKKKYVKKDFKIIRDTTLTHENGVEELQFIATDSSSSRGILVKNIVKEGVLYELKALTDTLESPSKFISEFYDNFRPLDTLIGKSFVEDKTDEFFTALRKKDSIVFKGYRFPYYNESHIDSLKYYISEFQYDQDTRHIQSYLIQRLGAMEQEEVWEFFTSYYDHCYGNSLAQIKILQALSSNGNEISLEILKDLMEQDLPLVSNAKEIGKLFKPFKKNLETAKIMYPYLLDFVNVQEYKFEIISLLADLKTENIIKSNTYKKYLSQIITDARIQLKRHLNRQNNTHLSRSSQYLSRKKNSEILEDYAILLYPYRKDKEVQQFFMHLLGVKASNVRVTQAVLMALDNEALSRTHIDSLAGDINSRLLIYERLKSVDKLHLFPYLYFVQEAMAESSVFEDRKFIASKDEVIFVGSRILEYKDESYDAFYFKVRSKQDFDQNFKLHMVVYPHTEEVITEYFYKNDGYRITDMDTDLSAMNYVSEVFELKDRSRAMAYHPQSAYNYNQLGY